MKKIFHVLSDLKFGDILHKAGSFFEGEVAEYGYLAEDKVIRIIEGAATTEEAAAIVKKEQEEKAAADLDAQGMAPQNTWGPKPDEAPADVSGQTTEADKTAAAAEAEKAAAQTEVKKEEAPLESKFKVLKEFTIDNPASKNHGTHKVGDIISADPIPAKSFIDQGMIEAYVEEEVKL